MGQRIEYRICHENKKNKNIQHRCKGSYRTSYPTFTCRWGITILKRGSTEVFKDDIVR